MQEIIFWFRRDLRLEDNTALAESLKTGLPVQAIFIFDTNILDELRDKKDKRVSFIYQQLSKLNEELHKMGATIKIYHGKPEVIFEELLHQNNIHSVFTNGDYEPYARKRDKKIRALLKSKNIGFSIFKDHVIYEKDEILKTDRSPYSVFTPYAKKWKQQFDSINLSSTNEQLRWENLKRSAPEQLRPLSVYGFEDAGICIPIPEYETIISGYDQTRDFPGIEGTTRLGIHLRFGTISIRKLAILGIELNGTFLDELIWRDFFQMILWHFPHVVNTSFKADYDKIKWRNNEKEFELWCKGETGYPFVDAGMRELNNTGFMHNRARMVTASFLCKHLLIDWRWGEAYFAEKLLDYDLAANNGNWQWAAGSGCDAAPFFRIFNPKTQAERFDKKGVYINKWIPELNSFDYPSPMVEHEFARARCLSTYKEALQK